MAEVLRHPILARNLEKNVSPADSIPQPHATIVDGMAMLEEMHRENCTFEGLSEHLLARVNWSGE